MKVMWKSGARVKVDAETAHEVMEEVRGECGGALDLDALVEKSRPKKAPLHGEFEWNNKTAADKYRREQARYLVRSLEVIHDRAPELQSRVYEVTHQASESESAPGEKPVFRRTEDILQDPMARDELLSRAIRDAIAFRRKYHALTELSQVFRALDDFLQKASG